MSYWLTPVWIADREICMLEDRRKLAPTEAVASFLSLLKSVHPRMLVQFKSNMLLSEDAEAACGIDELPFQLNSREDIFFGTDSLELSHCAQAYMDRLPLLKEMEIWLRQAQENLNLTLSLSEERAVIQEWLNLMKLWNDQGLGVTLLRGDE